MWNGQVFNTVNRLRLSKGLEVFTIDTDYGVAIVRQTDRMEISDSYRRLTYRQFAADRAALLNLKTYE